MKCDKTYLLTYYYKFLTDSRYLSPIYLISKYDDVKAWIRLQFILECCLGRDNDVNGLLEKKIEIGE